MKPAAPVTKVAGSASFFLTLASRDTVLLDLVMALYSRVKSNGV